VTTMGRPVRATRSISSRHRALKSDAFTVSRFMTMVMTIVMFGGGRTPGRAVAAYRTTPEAMSTPSK
jgi:hypothetical protein